MKNILGYLIAAILAVLSAYIDSQIFGPNLSDEILAIPPLVAAGLIGLAGAGINHFSNKSVMDSENSRRDSDRVQINEDMAPMSDFNKRLLEMQKTGYMNSVEGKGLYNAMNNNQRSQLQNLSNFASLGDFTAESKLAGMDKINKTTANGIAGLARNSTNYQRGLLGMEQRGISNYIGQKWNAINKANALSSQNAQNLMNQNNQNLNSLLNFGGQMVGAMGN